MCKHKIKIGLELDYLHTCNFNGNTSNLLGKLLSEKVLLIYNPCYISTDSPLVNYYGESKNVPVWDLWFTKPVP